MRVAPHDSCDRQSSLNHSSSSSLISKESLCHAVLSLKYLSNLSLLPLLPLPWFRPSLSPGLLNGLPTLTLVPLNSILCVPTKAVGLNKTMSLSHLKPFKGSLPARIKHTLSEWQTRSPCLPLQTFTLPAQHSTRARLLFTSVSSYTLNVPLLRRSHLLHPLIFEDSAQTRRLRKAFFF